MPCNIKISKRFKNISLNFIWYIFITIIIGQLGIFIAFFSRLYNEQPLNQEIKNQIANTNFLTFSVSLLVGSCYFLVKEIHSEKKLQRTFKKSILFLFTIITILLGSLAISFASQVQNKSINPTLHWMIYSSCIILSIIWWFFEQLQGNVNELGEEIEENVEYNIKMSKNNNSKSSTGVEL